MPRETARFQLEATQGADAGTSFALRVGEIHMGRASAPDREGTWIRLKEGSVSSHHATLRWDTIEQAWRLFHCSQTNATLVNGQTVQERLLYPSDTIQMGRATFRLVENVAPGFEARPRVQAVSAPPDEMLAEPAELKLKKDEVALFFSHLSIMLDVGIPLLRAVEAIMEQGGSAAMRGVARHMKVFLSTGLPFPESMQRFPAAFTDLQIFTVSAGVMCGQLPETLRDLARVEERDIELRRKVTGSLAYPLTVFVFAVLLVLFLGNQVFASLMPVLLHSGVELPWVTRALVAVTKALQDWRVDVVLGAAVVGGAVVLRRFLRTTQGEIALDRFLLAAPVIGRLVRTMALVRFCHCLSLLYSCGMPVIEALGVAAECSASRSMNAAAREVRSRVREGAPLPDALRQSEQFPDMLVGLVAVGVSTGNLDYTLNKAAELYDQNVEETLERAVTLLEPIVIMGMGVVVAIIIIAALLPMYRMISL